ncbi:MAG: DUF480 domain-containing protein [Planctomycetes bacterium]|nr:DUF480 domain-containing protein [Planctomycetota bacterium]
MTPDLELDALEARVLGVLIEKELTTPEAYPLTLNALVAGCNQKNNRDPVLELFDGDVYAALQKLVKRTVVGSVHPIGARVEKFRHNAAALYELPPPQLAIMAELLLRGPQQPGELRSRVARMHPIESQQALADALAPLLGNGKVRRLDPLPGSRAERYVQTIAPAAHPIEVRAMVSAAHAEGAAAPARSGASAVTTVLMPETAQFVRREDHAALERRVVELEDQSARLRRQLDHLAWSLGKKLEA